MFAVDGTVMTTCSVSQAGTCQMSVDLMYMYNIFTNNCEACETWDLLPRSLTLKLRWSRRAAAPFAVLAFAVLAAAAQHFLNYGVVNLQPLLATSSIYAAILLSTELHVLFRWWFFNYSRHVPPSSWFGL